MKTPELVVVGLDGAVDAYVAEKAEKGLLPNFARLLKRGCRLTDLRPPHPTVTPVCWGAFVTGATPELNGIVSDLLHLSGSLSRPQSGYHGDYLLGERFWESAARAGKTALVDSLPLSGPLRDRSGKIWQVEGTSCMPGRMLLPDSSLEYEGVPQQIWLFDAEMMPISSMKEIRMLSPSPAERKEEKIVLQVKMDFPGCNRDGLLPFFWEAEFEEGQFTLFCEGKKIPLSPGVWAEDIRRTLPAKDGKKVPHVFRFLLLPVPEGFLLFASASCNIVSRVFPEEFAFLLEGLPPTPVEREYIFFNTPGTYRIAMESWRKHNSWHIELLRRALKKRVPDILVTYFGDVDVVNHLAWNVYSGAVPADGEKKKFVERAFLEIYEEADRLLGYFLDEVADDDTTILVLSDHGSIGVPEPKGVRSVLEQAGLLHFLDKEKRVADCGKSSAIDCGYGNIFVNLAGREPDGIVPQEEYTKTVNRIIAALQEFYRSPDGASALAFAVRREEAGFFGLGGSRCGDVVYGLSAGRFAGTVHADQIPTAKNIYGSMRCLGLLSGPGIAGNSILDTPVTLMDLAPTLCRRLSVPLPKGCNGRIVQELADTKKIR